MEPVNQKYWIEKEKEAAALVASFFSLDYIESRNKFSYLDGGFAKGGDLIAMVEIKVTDYTPHHFHRSGIFRINGIKIKRCIELSVLHRLPFVVLAYCIGSGVFVWKVTNGGGLPLIPLEFKKERRPFESGRRLVNKEICMLKIESAIYLQNKL